MRNYIVTHTSVEADASYAPVPKQPIEAGTWRLIGPPVVVEYRQVGYRADVILRPKLYAFYWEKEADE